MLRGKGCVCISRVSSPRLFELLILYCCSRDRSSTGSTSLSPGADGFRSAGRSQKGPGAFGSVWPAPALFFWRPRDCIVSCLECIFPWAPQPQHAEPGTTKDIARQAAAAEDRQQRPVPPSSSGLCNATPARSLPQASTRAARVSCPPFQRLLRCSKRASVAGDKLEQRRRGGNWRVQADAVQEHDCIARN